jgi:hypothetical protein
MPIPKPKRNTAEAANAAKAEALRQPEGSGVVASRPALPKPEPAATALAGAGVWKLRVNHPFLFRHHKKNWDIEAVEGLEGVHWLPVIDRRPVVPGTGLIRTLRRGEEGNPEKGYQDEILKDEKAGWKYLWPNDPAEKGGQYLVSVPAEDPLSGVAGRHYTDIFYELVPAADSSENDKAVFNRAEYNKWRYNLVVDGVIAPPADGVRSQAGRRAQTHIGRATNNAGVHPEIRDRLISRAKELAAAVKAAQVPTEEAA